MLKTVKNAIRVYKTRQRFNSLERNFRAAVRSATRGRWKEVFTREEFIEEMTLAINRSFERAFAFGLEVCGTVDEITAEESLFVIGQLEINDSAIIGFADDFDNGNFKLLRTAFSRADMYVATLGNIFEKGQVFGCENQMLVWIWNPLKDHCPDCRFYNGQIHRANTWKKHKAEPKAWNLACRGKRCGCRFEHVPGARARGRLRPPRNA